MGGMKKKKRWVTRMRQTDHSTEEQESGRSLVEEKANPCSEDGENAEDGLHAAH